MRKMLFLAISLIVTLPSFGQNVRLSRDSPRGGYVSVYTMATGIPYRMPCSQNARSRGAGRTNRQWRSIRETPAS